ncbi:MAG: hypothetical protein IJX51_08700 [Clostridia bacterium]|nr:hypothetical protein [Clostridia bacterium]
MKKKKYKIIAEGKKANEEIMAILDDDGRIDKVASAYYDYNRDVYRLYPCSYGSYSTIMDKMTVSLYDVQLR